MILEKEILIWNNHNGLTSDMLDVKKLSKSDFPRLIFQDVMNQLKLPKLQIGFELESSQLFEVEPQNLECLEDSVRFNLDTNHTLNLENVLMYYLLCNLLQTDFKLTNIYTDNQLKSKLFFVNLIPFSTTHTHDLQFLKQCVKQMRRKQVQHVLERFFVLLGQQYRDKLMLFLTYLNQKYKFTLDKKVFIQTVLGEDNLMRVERDLNQIL